MKKPEPRLETLDHWKKLSPRQQGYLLYMQAELPGSELKGQTCPYTKGTAEHKQFLAGEQLGVQSAMDTEE